MKHPPPPIYLELFATLSQRKLARNHADFMRRYASATRAGWHFPASPLTLTRLWMSLNAAGQHDLAVIAHKALLDKASSRAAAA
jgi:hypothetical protein